MKASERLKNIDEMTHDVNSYDAATLARAQCIALLTIARTCIVESSEYHDETYIQRQAKRNTANGQQQV